MADKILIVGATGLIGSLLTRKLVGQGADEQMHLLLRRPYREDVGKAKIHVQLQENWPATIAKIKPDIAISCLGSTMKKAGSKEEFAAVDRDLVSAAWEKALPSPPARCSTCCCTGNSAATARSWPAMLRMRLWR